MAKTTVVQVTDDLDGSANAATYTFALQGTEYEIDLSTRNFKALEKVLAPYIDAATRVPRGSKRSGGSKTSKGGRTAPARRNLPAVRSWARDSGHEISDRGRIPKEILDAYDEAH